MGRAAFFRRPILLGLAVLSFAAVAQADPGVQAGKSIDPQRYLGRWYEVARTPNKFQVDCVAATSDWSRHSDGQFEVVQTCRVGSSNGPAKIWRGAGRIVDPVSNSEFRIGFFGGFIHMNYKILDRGDDYSWCILTNGNPKYVWIMSKRPTIPGHQKSALIARAKTLGFDMSEIVFDQTPPG